MNKKFLGRAALYTTTLLWGTSFVVTKNTVANAPPLWVLALRLCGAAVILLLINIKKIKNINRNCIRGGMIMGVLLTFAYSFQIYGISLSTPSKSAFLMDTYCVLVPFLSWIVFKKKLTKYNVLAAFLCFIGVWLISVKADSGVGLGDILSLTSGLFFGLHIIFTDRFVKDEDPMLLTLIQFSTAGLIFIIVAPLVYEFPTELPTMTWLSIAYLCLFCTTTCYLLQTFGQKYTPPETVSLILMLESVFGSIFSVIFYHEVLSAKTIVGFAFIFTAIYISETKLQAFQKFKAKQ